MSTYYLDENINPPIRTQFQNRVKEHIDRHSFDDLSQSEYHNITGHRCDIVCKHWTRWGSLCHKGEKCEHLHVLDYSKMAECTFFKRWGKCSNPECLFRHVDADEAQECPDFLSGFCPRGVACSKRHIIRDPCPNYLAGFCPLGPKCPLGHPRFEAKMPTLTLEPKWCSRCLEKGHTEADCKNQEYSRNFTRLVFDASFQASLSSDSHSRPPRRHQQRR